MAHLAHFAQTVEEIYDLAPVGFVTTDGSEISVRVNRTLLAWTGLNARDVLGHRWSEVILTNAGRILTETHVRPLLRMHNEARNIALDLKCSDGRRLPVLLTVVEQTRRDGQASGYLLTFVEAIDREQYQRELLDAKHRAELSAEQLRKFASQLERRVAARTKELQRANEELDSFAHVVSHDLRAPLRTMSGFSRILHEEYETHLDARGLKLLDSIDNAAVTMGHLIEGLLRLSLDSRGQLKLVQCDLTAIAEQIRDDLRHAYPDRTAEWSIAPNLSAWADRGMLEAVLRNLLGNAWKYSAKTPNAHIDFGSREVDGETVFVVSDNGAGFDMGYAKRLFQPFQRMHTKNEFPGLGIGLATVHRIIQRHGGRITAEAAPGKGAAFSFTLPTPAEDDQE